MENRHQRQHGKILAILFIFYGAVHLLAISFAWLIVLALARAGYIDPMRDAKTLVLFGVTLLTVPLPLVSAYSLLRGRRWAKAAVWLMCLVILVTSVVVMIFISLPQLSANRVIFVASYVGATIALFIYAIWFVKKKGVV
jgi:hypothetical protein